MKENEDNEDDETKKAADKSSIENKKSLKELFKKQIANSSKDIDGKNSKKIDEKTTPKLSSITIADEAEFPDFDFESQDKKKKSKGGGGKKTKNKKLHDVQIKIGLTDKDEETIKENAKQQALKGKTKH